MSARGLLDALEGRGVRLEVRGTRLRVDAPAEVFTPGLRAVLAEHKAELLALLQESTTVLPAPATAAQAPQEDPGPGLAPEAVANWACRGEVVTLRSHTLGGDVYLVPDAEAGAGLVATGVPRHRVYLPAELAALADLLRLPAGPRAAALRVIDPLREVFGPDLEVLTVRPVSPARCPACHGQRWWRSTAGARVCAHCHPPADPALVAGWLEEDPEC